MRKLGAATHLCELLCGLLCTCGFVFPQTETPAQPLPFSHKTHVAVGLKCQECHPNPDPGEHMTFPAATTCMVCHTTVGKDKPAIQKLAEFARLNEPISWERIYVVPGDVYWNHRSHLRAGLTCQGCHGDVARMNVTARATEAAFMAGCVECHKQRSAPTGCEFCHEAK